MRGGNVVPADGRWLHGDELSVDQAALTGESLPVAVPREDGDEVGSGEKLWSGSIIKTGEAEMLVTETGLNTMMGEAAKSIQESSGHQVGLLESKIQASGKVLILITLVAVSALLYYQVVVRGQELGEILEMSLCLVIASVPVALPMVLKVTLSVGAKELAGEGAIVTHLTALEEVASMRVLCSDKTGTLTTAQMTVYHSMAKCWNGFTAEQVLTYAAVASNAANKDDAIDRAVYQAFAEMSVGPDGDVDVAADALGKKFRTEKYFGFNPTVKRTVADVLDLNTGKKLRVAKGHRRDGLETRSCDISLIPRHLAIGIVSKILETGADGGETWKCSDFDTIAPSVRVADAEFGKQGYKTIAVAVGVNGGPMKYAGTLPIMDPPRSDTASTIANIRGSGVAVKMITGDHLNIAKEMARQIELGTNIMPNTELWPVSAQRDELIHWADGFAQVMPKDKHEVVAVLQQAGLVVGMTGDGVNDAPALAKAQVGVAVAGATDAAQTAADIILTREGLGPIFTAILTSRRIFKRLKAYVVYRICCTVQVVCFLCFLSFVFNEAFSALYIILLALFHDLTIVTIAYDKQTPSAQPETPTVRGLVVQSYAMGLFLAAGSCILFVYGHAFMSESFVESFKYKEALMFLQITNSSAFLIFSARTPGFFFASTPDNKLAGSAIASQLVVNGLVLFSGG